MHPDLMKRVFLFTIACLCSAHSALGGDLYTRSYHAPALIASAPEMGFGDEAKDRSPLERALITLGVDFPEGASAISADGRKLVLRTTLVGHEITEMYLESLRASPKGQLHIFHELIEVEKRDFSEWLFANRMTGNADALRTELQQWISDGRAAVYHVSAITTTSGQRAKARAVEAFLYTSEYDPPSMPKEVSLSGDARAPIVGVQGTACEVRNVGTTIEVDPVIGRHGSIIDLNLAPEIVTHAGETVWPHADADPLRRMTFPIFHTGKITTQITQAAGHYFLLGTTEPREPSEGFSDSLLVNFIRSDVGHPHGDQLPIVETDYEPELRATAPQIDGMEIRVFTAAALLSMKGRGAKSEATAKSILEGVGVSFPPGSAAFYVPSNSELTVRNKPEQLEVVEAYTSTVVPGEEKQLLITTEFIELPQALASTFTAENSGNRIRELAQQSIRNGDAKLLRLASVTARSGQRAKAESIEEIIYGTEIDPGVVPDEIELEDGAVGPVVGPVPAAFETRNLGVTLEVDPVFGVDGYTIDLNLAPEIVTLTGYDHFPSAEADPALKIAQPIFHELKGTTQITVSDGSYELLYTARPHQPSEGMTDTVVLVFVRADVSRVRAE